MDAVEYVKTLRIMCKNQANCPECPLHGKCKEDGYDYCIADISEYAEKAVRIVEQWAKEQPVKTRQSELLKMFPNANIDDSGVIHLCPRDFLSEVAGGVYCVMHGNCKACRKDYWLTEVDN